MSASPEPSKTPEFPPTPFLSPRNVPLWFSLLLIAAIGGLVWWTH
ncbi:hypothetical protein [Phenylobacterium sp.]|nr:hypothetical protein [Phenylobacterium sp.]HEX3365101.1 hypothetical protein [Phenylobacterium sp.]